MLLHSLLNNQHTLSDISYYHKHTAQKMGYALFLIITSSVGPICDTASSTTQEITSSSSSCSSLVMSSTTLNLICMRWMPVQYRITDDTVDADLISMEIEAAISMRFLRAGDILILPCRGLRTTGDKEPLTKLVR